MAEGQGTDWIAEAQRQWTRHWGRAATPPMAAATSIMRVQQLLLARMNELLKPFELTFPRYEALMLLYLSRNGSLPLGKMGVRLQVHRTSVTNLVDGLEAAGLARRVPHERDRRTTLAAITDSGRAAAERATEILNAERFGTAPLSRSELEAITALLGRLRADADGFEEGSP